MVISDNTFDPADWSVEVSSSEGASQTNRQEGSGGNPGAFRAMRHILPPVGPSETARVEVIHIYQGAGYNPGIQGAISSIDFFEETKMLSLPFPEAFIRSFPVIVQNGQIYRSKTYNQYIGLTTWSSGRQLGLMATDFVALDGVAEQPDFSTNGGEMRFGYFRGSSRLNTYPPYPANQDLVIEHGIDNWQIMVRPEKGPIIISDDTFAPADWALEADIVGGGNYGVQQETSGGNPGDYQTMQYTIKRSQNGLGRVTLFHLYQAANYDPAIHGSITQIDYAEDVLFNGPDNSNEFVKSYLVIVQDGRRYRSNRALGTRSSSWRNQTITGLAVEDFVALDGGSDLPNFAANGSPLFFGFMRGHPNDRPVTPEPGELFVYNSGIDNWRVAIWPGSTAANQPPVPKDDLLILSGQAPFPIKKRVYVLNNDSDPDNDPVTLVTVNQPTYGEVLISRPSPLTDPWVDYERFREGYNNDRFTYEVSDGHSGGTATVDVVFDCVCSVRCIDENEPALVQSGHLSTAQAGDFDLGLIYRIRDEVLKSTPTGQRYIDHYYTETTEIARLLILEQPSLGAEAVETVLMWQDNLRSLVDGDGRATISQEQVDATFSFIEKLYFAGSEELKGVIAAELEALGPLDEYVGLTMAEAKTKAIGHSTLYLPLIVK